eukprot:GSChrysophyteH1.ASY1.ANO1.663.1 assembled CDS
MSASIVVNGDITAEDVAAALSAFYQDANKNVVISTETDEAGEASEPKPGTITVNANLVSALQSSIAAKSKTIANLEKTSSKALASVQTFHLQQKQLFDEFVLLRQRYDEQKTQLLDTLWDKCVQSHEDLSEIPNLEDENYLEDENTVGIYNLSEVLGEGQFALVRSCTISHSRGDPAKHDLQSEFAMKTLTKDRLLSFHSLKRVSNEIKILRSMDNPYIVKTYDVIQTKKKLYIVTEKGGLDLFEFFDEHPEGVPESWAREIVKCTLAGVVYCHHRKVSHRDLKPENILVKFDADSGLCSSLKLCDFGLAAIFDHNKPFTDFCGSPGFFAPEMITRGSYFGDKVDIWSCGCILLELVLGHERFCEIWMVAYDYEVMQEKASFSKEIKNTLEKLKQELDFSDSLNNFIMLFLQLRQSQRTSVANILNHEWLGLTQEEKLALIPGYNENEKKMCISQLTLEIENNDGRNSPLGAAGSPCSTPDLRYGQSVDLNDHQSNSTDPELLKNAFHNQSQKERRLYEDFNKMHAQNDSEQVHLPPIEPQTPNVVHARKILLKGADLANKLAHQSPATTPGTPNVKSGWQTPQPSPSLKGSSSDPSLGTSGSPLVALINPDGSSLSPGLVSSPLMLSSSPKPLGLQYMSSIQETDAPVEEGSEGKEESSIEADQDPPEYKP